MKLRVKKFKPYWKEILVIKTVYENQEKKLMPQLQDLYVNYVKIAIITVI